jgi:hypothetical protein
MKKTKIDPSIINTTAQGHTYISTKDFLNQESIRNSMELLDKLFKDSKSPRNK